ncbi:MAG TPA: 23S rRNA (uracil(1939)-C(5))-methyltransferase RlmD [Candidatus Dormibacteraeota bacterium]|nr:23S rRNA (uracil(1939)-C(5))-methyltransferase RlmD [Candidatus Dormibacteraeota bacterium]
MTNRSATNPAPSLGQEVILSLTDLLANGQGVGRAGGMVVFVSGALPGERVRVRISSLKANYAVGELLDVLVRSPQRTEAFCPVFGACGGCQVQHLAYPAQLHWKRNMVTNAFKRIAGVEAQVSETIGMLFPRAYRNKMSLVVQERSGERYALGFYQPRSHDVVPIEACPIVLPQLDGYVRNLAAMAHSAGAAAIFRGVRHVVARAGRALGHAVVSLTTERPAEHLDRAASQLLAALPGVVGLQNSFEPASQNAVMGRRQRTIWGQPEMEEAIEGIRFRVSAASFFQVNSEMVGQIFRFISSGLTKPRRIVDLYCGAGTFSIFFARLGCTVFGVEESAHAIDEARANAALNGVERATEFAVGRVEEALREPRAREALRAASIAFLDPPRKGVEAAALEALAAARVPNVWYLSCNPATLARDVAQLHAAGYEIGIVQPFDMFPQTGHVEVLCTLWRKESGPAADQEVRLESAGADVSRAPQEEKEYPDFVIR